MLKFNLFLAFLVLTFRDIRLSLALVTTQSTNHIARNQPKISTTKIYMANENSFFRVPFIPTKPPKDDDMTDDIESNTIKVLSSLGIEPTLCEPKKFSFKSSQFLDIITASFTGLMRLGNGAFAQGYKISVVPKDDSKYTIASVGDYQLEETCLRKGSTDNDRRTQPIILYEFEACPFCRKVREAVSILSLDVEFRPCPKGGTTYRNEIKTKYGVKATFPYMKDPNTGVEMFESDEIIAYLFQVYGYDRNTDKINNMIPWMLSKGGLTTLSSSLALLPRLNKGLSKRASNQPPKPLTLWSYESSPFCKIVRERLCEYQIRHVQISCPRGSPNRQILYEKMGNARFQVPYLEDPNHNIALFESAAILEYLEKMYGVKPTPVKYM